MKTASASLLMLLMLAWAGFARTGATQPPADAAPAFVGADTCASCHQTIHDTWKSGRHSKMLQPASKASVVGDFSKASVTLTGTRFPAARGRRRLLHHLGSDRQGAWNTRSSHARQPPHPALPDHDRQGHDRRPAADLGRAAPRMARTTWTSSGLTRTSRTAGSAVEQGLRRLPRQPAGEQLHAGDRDLCDGLARLRHVVRAMPWAGQRPRAGVRAHREPSGQRRGHDRPADAPRSHASSMICAQCHSLRNPVDSGLQAGSDYYDYFMPGARVRPRARVSTWRTGPTAARAVSRTMRLASGKASASCAAARPARIAITDPHLPNVDQNPTAGARRTTRCAPAATRRSARA